MKILITLSAGAPVALLGFMLGVMSMSPPEFATARGLLGGAVIAAVGWYLLWFFATDEPLWAQVLVGTLVGAATLGGSPLVLDWISQKERALPTAMAVLSPILTTQPRPDFDEVGAWSVSLRLGSHFAGEFDNDLAILQFQPFQFVNLSRTQIRVLDITIVVTTDDPKIPEVRLSTETTPAYYRAEYDKTRPDQRPHERIELLLPNPIIIPASSEIEGIVPLALPQNIAKRVWPIEKEHPLKLDWVRAKVFVFEHRSGITREFQYGDTYNANTGEVTHSR